MTWYSNGDLSSKVGLRITNPNGEMGPQARR